MPGMLGYSFRQGDRSEYLALYFLSALGVSVPVPRQEDIGVDFQCVLAKRTGLVLTFKSPFIVQVKSSADNLTIKYGGYDAEKKRWRGNEIEWLYSQEVPFLVAIVNKAQSSLELFATSPMWRAKYTGGGNPGQVTLTPGIPVEGKDIGFNEPEERPDWPNGNGDQKEWGIPLGPPILRLQGDDAENPEIIERARQILDWSLLIEQQNITYRRLKIPYFQWPLRIVPNSLSTIGVVGRFYGWSNVPPAAIADQIGQIAPALFSLALNLKGSGRIDDLLKLKGIFSLLGVEMFPNFLAEQLSEIFGHQHVNRDQTVIVD